METRNRHASSYIKSKCYSLYFTKEIIVCLAAQDLAKALRKVIQLIPEQYSFPLLKALEYNSNSFSLINRKHTRWVLARSKSRFNFSQQVLTDFLLSKYSFKNVNDIKQSLNQTFYGKLTVIFVYCAVKMTETGSCSGPVKPH
ncbi:ras-related protein Rab-5C [Platysternon megacephalum]|uniref:Ras-related protein Rab-5C n=1 Tax=Platysternon megacephalum TaxID=55544 RepID=A0A4D9EZI9_9SAUR|nr:ras-related protein Rab-5C [Platysternon megacephalum]